MLEICRLGTALGAEIRGLDLSQPLDAASVDVIRRAFLEHIVLIVRSNRFRTLRFGWGTERFGGRALSFCLAAHQ
jgi:alpha-ketoglutarate-dependent taurine dioxygenase